MLSKYDSLVLETRQMFPKFKIIKKSDSFFMKLINFILVVISFGKNRTFMHDFTTTIGFRMYVPDEWDKRTENERIRTLRHERVHMHQIVKYGGLRFTLGYLFWPVPVFRARFRRDIEMEAYEETMRALIDEGKPHYLFKSWFRNNIIDHFTSAEYFWTWTKKEDIEVWYDRAADELTKK